MEVDKFRYQYTIFPQADAVIRGPMRPVELGICGNVQVDWVYLYLQPQDRP